jgi:hypothetical protein
MKDFAKSIVCNTKAEAEKVGNSYQYAGSIPIEKIPDNWRPEFPKAGYIVYYAPNKAKWFATESEAKRFAESQDKAQKTGNRRVGNAGNKNPDWNVGNYDWDVGIFNGQWYITKNGQKFKGPFRSMNEAARYLDGHKWEFEGKLAKSKTGNSRVGNELTSYEKAKKSDLEKRLKKEEQLLEDAKKMLRSKLSDDDRIGFQMQKEECEKNVSRLKEEIRKIGNKKVGNSAKTFSGKYIDIYDNGTVVVKEGWAFGERASVNTFERWLDYNIQAKEKVLKETKAMKEEFKKNFI